MSVCICAAGFVLYLMDVTFRVAQRMHWTTASSASKTSDDGTLATLSLRWSQVSSFCLSVLPFLFASRFCLSFLPQAARPCRSQRAALSPFGTRLRPHGLPAQLQKCMSNTQAAGTNLCPCPGIEFVCCSGCSVHWDMRVNSVSESIHSSCDSAL